VRAFYGQDLHWKRQYRGMMNRLQADRSDRTAVLDALKAGQYLAEKGELQLPSNGVLSPAQLREFGRVHGRSRRMRGWMTQTKRWMEGIGLRVPGSVKTQLRRIF